MQSPAVKLILERFMRGEIDANRAAQELRAAPTRGDEYQYVVWPEGQWSNALLQSKMAELSAVMDRGSRIEIGSAPFRRADFTRRANALRRMMFRGGLLWLAPQVALFLFALLRPGFLGLSRTALAAVFLILFITTALILGLRGQQLSRSQGLRCPYCGVDLVGTDSFGGAADVAVLATGECPQCGKRLLDPNDRTGRTA